MASLMTFTCIGFQVNGFEHPASRHCLVEHTSRCLIISFSLVDAALSRIFGASEQLFFFFEEFLLLL